MHFRLFETVQVVSFKPFYELIFQIKNHCYAETVEVLLNGVLYDYRKVFPQKYFYEVGLQFHYYFMLDT